MGYPKMLRLQGLLTLGTTPPIYAYTFGNPVVLFCDISCSSRVWMYKYLLETPLCCSAVLLIRVIHRIDYLSGCDELRGMFFYYYKNFG